MKEIIFLPFAIKNQSNLIHKSIMFKMLTSPSITGQRKKHVHGQAFVTKFAASISPTKERQSLHPQFFPSKDWKSYNKACILNEDMHVARWMLGSGWCWNHTLTLLLTLCPGIWRVVPRHIEFYSFCEWNLANAYINF